MKIIVRNLQRTVKINQRLVRCAVNTTLSEEGRLSCLGQIVVVFVSDKDIRRLNRCFLKRRGTTDVMAFDISRDSSCLEAEVVVCVDTALKNVKIFQSKPQEEIILCVVHGVLHLLGYRDDTTTARQKMQRQQERILSLLKIPAD